jgi:DNA invertase Pin-like site-specific DNA recombinase
VGNLRRSGMVRCAIYTRKSSEEGLEQAFNSLDAQREACEAYVRSQKHEGWSLLPDFYDDGGISGGTMERPALKRLLADIEGGRVDTVVVYKVDRLTRSLSDFSKIVSVFDARGVSFVSITQQFNTTTSMGRLTLNMLLSFAQFEREVTGERIRDKVAASKKKGMWMGGVVPLGYEVKDRKLIVNEPEAGTVRLIYRRYVELGSVRLLAEDLKAQGIRGKAHASPGGEVSSEGSILARGALYRILSNRLYRGEVHHQGSHYPGEHLPIIDQELWNSAARLLADNRDERKHGVAAEAPSLLAGLLFDPAGEPLTPSHASKTGRRYRYYVSRALVTGSREDAPEGLRLPAGDIEGLVENRLRHLLASQTELHALFAPQDSQADTLWQLLTRAGSLSQGWRTLEASRRRAILLAIISRVTVHPDRLSIQIRPAHLRTVLAAWPKAVNVSPGDDSPGDHHVTLTIPARLKRSGIGKRMIIAGQTATETDPSLVKLMLKAFDLQAALLDGKGSTLEQVAARQGINSSYATRLLRLSFLSPELVRMILDGRHPASLTARRLLADTRLPIAWSEQLAALT